MYDQDEENTTTSTIEKHLHVHVHIHAEPDSRIDKILTAINQLVTEEKKTMADLTALTEQVSSNTDVVNSAVVLIAGLADQLQAAASDPAAVQALADTLRTNNQALADAVAANTPAAPPAV